MECVQVRTPVQMERSRVVRLELLLLGMAIAREGDREKILSRIKPEMMSSPLIGQCLHSLDTMDDLDIQESKESLKFWGLDVKGKVVDSLIQKLEEINVGTEEGQEEAQQAG